MPRLTATLLACSLATMTAATIGRAEAPAWTAGAAVADITPKHWPIPLVGSFSFRLADKAHDPLSVRALVMSDGTHRMAIAVVDSCLIGREVLDRAKAIASKESGIPTSWMLVSATHTHSAPPANAAYRVDDHSKGGKGEKSLDSQRSYVDDLVEGIAAAIVNADKNRQPAQVGWSSSAVPDEVFNRRWFMKHGTIPTDPFGGTTDLVKMNPPRGSKNLINPAGPTDPEVSVLAVRDKKGRPIAVLANYSLHYVGGIPGGMVSADYFGEFARLMENRLRGQRPTKGFVAILSNGTSGDINNINFRNPRPPREPFEQVKIVAAKVADATFQAYRDTAFHDWVSLGMTERELTLQRREVTKEQVEAAKKTLATEDEKQLPRLAKAYARRAISLAGRAETSDIKLQALRIGELGIVAIPFETFVEIGLEIKERSPLHPTFTIELANGADGYLPTPEQHKLGGYETWLGTNKVEYNASRKITETLLDMLESLAAQKKSASGVATRAR
ncbi:Neutral/alkaline non-lysosomal ceramidase [Planctomycetes bacterium Pan216]|uniref:Neutral/alkaline non-lysosomal ceramidase n=1 Tax=Kolteria novifilia TaxID=2527975 RepID=A0A518B8H0_9BACT|nr:Neutral/alkaline non-lysosomal ceramidase [Planctomycetes bacterium Pan216]